MTDSLNRPTEQRRTGKQWSDAAASRGSYTDRHDRPRQARRPEGTYVSGAAHRPRPGRYTDADGAVHDVHRTDGYYTKRG